MTKSEITTDDVLDSESFRLLNLLIDEAEAELKFYDAQIKERGAELGECQRIAPLKKTTHEERLRGADDGSIVDLDLRLKHLVEMREERKDLLDRIRFLQRVKLRLQNDWDFTHGDDSFQRAVLAPETLEVADKETTE